MAEINLIDKLPKTKRDPGNRAATITGEDKRVAREFGRDYFDGPRNRGYGGYKYDGRWIPVAERFVEHYGLDKDSVILDVGCAKGFLLNDFMKVVPGIKVVGIDVSQYAIDNSMSEVKAFLQLGNAKDLSRFGDKSFDLVISINTIHNLSLDDCKLALKEIERVGKNAFITNDAWRNDHEKKAMMDWNITARTFMHIDDWKKLFEEVGYTGDYYWFIP